jgi:negative regulator of sigma E activity
MRIRLLIAGLAGLSLAAAGFAEPPKTPVANAEQSAGQQAPVVVAAADEAPATTASDQQQPQQSKPARHARVTTCRCGDQTPSD